jgi:hypothetical protein
VDGKNVVPAVHQVLDAIRAFSDDVRSGKLTGATGKPLSSVIAIGIGGRCVARCIASKLRALCCPAWLSIFRAVADCLSRVQLSRRQVCV